MRFIDALNPVLLGWGRFYQHCYCAKQVFTRIDHYVWDRLRRWLRKKYPKTPRLVIRRRYWRRLPGRARYRWADQRPVAIVADLKVGRHDLLKMRMPDYAYPARESLASRCFFFAYSTVQHAQRTASRPSIQSAIGHNGGLELRAAYPSTTKL